MVPAPRSFARPAAGSRAKRRAQLTSPAWAGGARNRERSVGGRESGRGAERSGAASPLQAPRPSLGQRGPGIQALGRRGGGRALPGWHRRRWSGTGASAAGSPGSAPALFGCLSFLSGGPGARWRRPARAQTTTRRPRYSLVRSPARCAPSGSEQRAASVSGDGSGARSA